MPMMVGTSAVAKVTLGEQPMLRCNINEKMENN
jgi:hypothetical protein